MMKQSLKISRFALPLLGGSLLIALTVPIANVLVRAAGAQSRDPLTTAQAEIEKQRQRLSSADVEERRDALLKLGRMRRPEASRVAMTGLADPAPIVRVTAASAVLSLPAEESTSALLPLLTDKDEFVRREAAYALGHTGSRRAVPALIERLNIDKENGVRGAAATALGRIGDDAAVTTLTQVLTQPRPTQRRWKVLKGKAKENQYVLRAAARSLGQIGSRAGVPALIDVLSKEDLPEDVRREAARSLGLIGDLSAVPALKAAMAARDPYLSRIAFESLRKIAPNEIKSPS